MITRVMNFKNKEKAQEWYWKLSYTMNRVNSSVKSVSMDYNCDKKCYEVSWDKVVR